MTRQCTLGHQACAFHEVAVQHLDALYRYALSLTRNEAESEDLVQETFLRALHASERLRPGSNVKSWLFTILRNTRLNEVQRAARNFHSARARNHAAASLAATQSQDDPHLAYLCGEKRVDVRNAIEALTPAHREIILLREFEDLSYEEIAEVLNCRLGTVMSRLARAREKLKSRLHSWDERPKDPPPETEHPV